jgi:poly-gamma-glutamate capsule biosynthesis protein CapA/YwtB (metallophosphatase superfamily)
MRSRLVLLIAAVALFVGACGSALDARTDSHRRTREVMRTVTATNRPAQRQTTTDLTVEVNGDILVHTPVWERALADGHGNYDFFPMLHRIAPYVRSADLAICHIETPMSSRPPQSYPVFNTPTQLARAIHKAGWRICDTASNHSLDMGQYGIEQTGRALDRARVLHTGSFPSAAARRHVLMVNVKGVRVAFLAYTEMTNGIPLPHPWSVNLASAPLVRADARRARRLGAQVVIVNFHWGDEFQSQPSTFQRSLADALTKDSDITAIVGQHVHVVQPIRRVNGKLVVFGEGQILSNQSSACCPVQTEDGMLVFLHIVVNGKRSRVTKIDYVPTWDRHPDYTVLPIGDALRRGSAPASELRASYARTTSVVGRARGRLEPMPLHLP